MPARDPSKPFSEGSIRRERRVCHTEAEWTAALKWRDELEDQARLLDFSIHTTEHGPNILEAEWIDD